jgi:hypothetical protein
MELERMTGRNALSARQPARGAKEFDCLVRSVARPWQPIAGNRTDCLLAAASMVDPVAGDEVPALLTPI